MITGKRYAENVISKQMNKLSLLKNCFFDAEYILDIPPKCFNPAPRVMSSMIKLTPKSEYDIDGMKELTFRYMFFIKKIKLKMLLLNQLLKHTMLKVNRLHKEWLEN